MMKHGSAPQRAAEALRAQAYYPAGVAAQPAPAPQGAGFMATQTAGFAPPIQTQVVPPQVSMPTQVVAPMPSPATISLVATSGPLTGQRFAIQGLFEVGREGSGLSLSFDSSASRRHASFAPVPGGLQMNDLGSTNGTFVNDQKVPNSTLRPGDHVRIGVTTFRVE
jgi:hypothetical protein